jgi:transcriptional regulator with XRE-family HTH domain
VPRKLDNEPPAPTELRLFTKHLKFVREHKKISQRDLAELAGVTQHYIWQLENEQATIGLDSMAFISQALQIPLYRILNPLLTKSIDSFVEAWPTYQVLVDNSNASPYERKLFAANFRSTRLSQGYMLKEAVEQTKVNKAFLVRVEKAQCGINLTNALKLSSFLMVPFVELITPKELKQVQIDLMASENKLKV